LKSPLFHKSTCKPNYHWGPSRQ